MGDRMMLGAATLFAATTTFATAVSVRQQQLSGEPLGLRFFPGRVPVHLALGLGSGIAAPWPMPVVAMVAATRAKPGVRWPERTCATIGAVVLVTTLAEPAARGLRARSAWAKATVPLNLLSGAALFLAGMRSSGSHRASPGPRGARSRGSRASVLGAGAAMSAHRLAPGGVSIAALRARGVPERPA